MHPQFGGGWTERKLGALKEYLEAYTHLMRGNKKASHFTLTYLDGFAGSGRRYSRPDCEGQARLVEFEGDEGAKFSEGSARIALSLQKPFDRYRFVDIDPGCIAELEHLKAEFAHLNVAIKQGDANVIIPQWCRALRAVDRALVFLDPYGMQVQWQTLEALARTEKVDLWLLFPVGQAVNRLLTKGEPPKEWAAALTRLFGTEGWREEFYEASPDGALFEAESATMRSVNYSKITRYMIDRLKTCFAGVLDEPIVLRNSTGIPLYVLCFAASNQKGATPALNIARAIARKFNDAW